MPKGKSLREAYGEALVKYGSSNDRIVALDADLSKTTMTAIFSAKYPERFYNFGIAEANMVCAAAGFAHAGLIPFVNTFAIFGAGRAFEQVRNTVCYTSANVKLVGSHAGLSVGEDGGSHQAIEDIALMRALPGMTVFAPCDAVEMDKAVAAALEINGPVYIRSGRPACDIVTQEADTFVPGVANVLREGKDVSIFAMGLMVSAALSAADKLAEAGIQASVVNFHTIKPFDVQTALRMAELTGAVISVEEHSVIGGLASATSEALFGKTSAKFAAVGIEDVFGRSGSPASLFEMYDLTDSNIVKKCRDVLAKK